MKNFNLCLIALLCGFFLFVHNPCHASKTSLIVRHPSGLIKTVPDDGIDPDWLIFIGHYNGNIIKTNYKVNAMADSGHSVMK